MEVFRKFIEFGPGSHPLLGTPSPPSSRVNILQVFLTTTSLIAIVTVIFCGGATQPLLKALHIPVSLKHLQLMMISANLQVGVGQPGEEGGGHGGEEGGAPQVLEGNGGEPRSLETGVGQVPKSRSSLARGWGRLDRNFLKPLLTNCPPSLQVLTLTQISML